MLQRASGTAQTGGGMCRGRESKRSNVDIDRKGLKRCWSLVKQSWSVCLPD